MARTTTRTHEGIDRRTAAGIMSIWMIVILFLVALGPAQTLAQTPGFASQGVQFGQPINIGDCTSAVDAEIQKLLNDPLVAGTRWIRINLMYAAPTTTRPCDPTNTYATMLSNLGPRFQIIGLLSNDFVAGAGETPHDFAVLAGAVADNPVYDQIDVWEIWNEPDHTTTGTWLAHADFAQMLYESRQEMQGEVLISGGVVSGTSYLEQVRTILGNAPYNTTLGATVNGIGIHPYTENGRSGEAGNTGIDDFILAYRSTFGMQLYITEFGWGYDAATQGAAQCRNLAAAFSYIRNQGYIPAAVWFKMQGIDPLTGVDYGLYNPDLTSRATAQAYHDVSNASCPVEPTPCPGMANGVGTTDATINQVCPVPPRVLQSSAGDRHSCALMDTGIVKCWGQNTYGQIGDGTTTNRSTPTQVSGLSGVTAIGAGGDHNCAVLSTGSVSCWGRNFAAQLGDGTTTNRLTPVTVNGVSGATAVAGSYFQTCAIVTGGAVKCWGNHNTTIRTISGLSNATAIAVGSQHACALINTGTVRCWGPNMYGQLGNGTTTSSTTPVTVSGLSGVVAIGAGYDHSCAILNTGAAKCWGRNNYGQLGDGTLVNRTTPASVLSVSGATMIDSTAYHTCATQSDGVAKCWGVNIQGQLGDNTTTNRSTPVSVIGLSGSPAITPGRYHTCARTFLGGMKCWGSNWEGALGDGTTTSRRTPVDVIGLN